jgi:hypothetical protein
MVDFEIKEFPSPHTPEITIHELWFVDSEDSDLRVIILTNDRYPRVDFTTFSHRLSSLVLVNRYSAVFEQAFAAYDQICAGLRGGQHISLILETIHEQYRLYRAGEN